MSGIILPDVPFEEKQEFDEPFSNEGLDVVSLIAPTSHKRIRTIARSARGFVYCVSSLGVTGVRSEITSDVGAMVDLVREANPAIPTAVGFGISSPDQATRMAALSDGVIVGSAIVRMIAQHGEDATEPVVEYVRDMKRAVMQAASS
jgi:tryptophan synthase alpha chain